MKKFKMIVANVGSEDSSWEEDYEKDVEDPRAWAEGIVSDWNSSLRSHETERVLVDVIVEKELKYSSVRIADEDEVCLEITSWIGTSAGAQHYYGNLHGHSDSQSKKVDVTKKLTLLESQRLSKAWDFEYGAGTEHTSIETKKKVRKAALSLWKESFPNAKILFEGYYASLEPKLVIAYVPDVPQSSVNALNKLVREYKSTRGDALDPSDEMWDELDQLNVEWENMLYDAFVEHVDFRTKSAKQ